MSNNFSNCPCCGSEASFFCTETGGDLNPGPVTAGVMCTNTSCSTEISITADFTKVNFSYTVLEMCWNSLVTK